MSRLYHVLAATLAMNFLLLAGGVVWMVQSGRLDRQKVAAIQALLFPPPLPVEGEATLQSAMPSTTQPTGRLDDLLAKYTGLPTGEQVEAIQQSIDARLAIVDRREVEVGALRRQVELARQQLERDRGVLRTGQQELSAQQEEAARLAGEKGFQDSLALYSTLSARQVKTIFLSLDDPTIVRYLQAMEPRTAARIIREFKSPEEIQRIQRLLEAMRQAEQDASRTPPSTQPQAAVWP